MEVSAENRPAPSLRVCPAEAACSAPGQAAAVGPAALRSSREWSQKTDDPAHFPGTRQEVPTVAPLCNF